MGATLVSWFTLKNYLQDFSPKMFKVVRWYDAAAGQEAGPEGERAVRDDGVVAEGHEGQIVADAAIEWRTISWGQS